MFPIQYKFNGQAHTAWGVERWSEVKKANFVPLVRTLYLGMKQPEARYQIPILCTTMPQAHYLALEEVQAALLLAEFDYLLDFVDLPSQWQVEKLEIRHILSGQYLPLQVLHGPSDKLKNLTFEEFIFVESFFDAYAKSENQQKLDQFCAILFRPRKGNKDKTGDVREPFNPHSVDRRAAYIANIPFEIKQSILLNYIGCKAAFPKLYPTLFSSQQEEEPEEQPIKRSFSWLETAFRMVEHRPADLEILKKQNLHEVLASLNVKVRDNEVLKMELESMRRKHQRS